MRMRPIFATAIVAVAALAGGAQAATCSGRAPAEHTEIRGPVLEVLDGRRLCVAQGFDPASWVELRLADAPEASARGALMAASFGQDVTCRIVSETPDGPVATCRTREGSVGRLSGEPRMVEAGRSWR